MLKIIGAGYPRTGTTSLKIALEQLGSDMFEDMDHNNALEWVSLNDPTVYSTPTPNSTAEPMAMLFHSASLRGLVVARTANPCESGSCA